MEDVPQSVREFRETRDPLAFQRIERECRPFVESRLIRRGADRNTADELATEVLRKFVEQYDPRRDPERYLAKITKNAWTSEQRRRGRLKQRKVISTEIQADGESRTVQLTDKDAAEATDIVELSEDVAALTAALDLLAATEPRCAAALRAKYYERLTDDEGAQSLAMRLGQYKHAAKRGLELLEDAMTGHKPR